MEQASPGEQTLSSDKLRTPVSQTISSITNVIYILTGTTNSETHFSSIWCKPHTLTPVTLQGAATRQIKWNDQRTVVPIYSENFNITVVTIFRNRNRANKHNYKHCNNVTNAGNYKNNCCLLLQHGIARFNVLPNTLYRSFNPFGGKKKF